MLSEEFEMETRWVYEDGLWFSIVQEWTVVCRLHCGHTCKAVGKLCATDVIWHNAQSNVFLKAVHDTQERGVEKSVHVFSIWDLKFSLKPQQRWRLQTASISIIYWRNCYVIGENKGEGVVAVAAEECGIVSVKGWCTAGETVSLPPRSWFSAPPSLVAALRSNTHTVSLCLCAKCCRCVGHMLGYWKGKNYNSFLNLDFFLM